MASSIGSYVFVSLTYLICFHQLISIVSSCALRKFNRNSYVCVCDESYCDSLIEIESPPSGYIHMYETSKDGLRFHKSSIRLVDPESISAINESPILFGSISTITITLNPLQKYQSIEGFGGAITDAAGINIHSLSNRMGESVIRDCFGPDGLEYSLARIPIGSTESSTRDYSLAENPSNQLDDFDLADEDIWYKIPVIDKAKTLKPNLKLIASPWNAPTWMVDLRKGRPDKAPLKADSNGRYYKLWALYIVKFLQAYKSHGIDFWALTSGNKPFSSFNANGPNGIPMYPYQLKSFIESDLGPLLNQSGFNRDTLKLLILDDSISLTNYFWIPLTIDDPLTRRFVSGFAFHWYKNDATTRYILDYLHFKYPHQLMLSTEAAEGYRPGEERVSLGDWKRAENYGLDIIRDINHWANGWIESNIALDMIGGPSKSRRFQDSPIIINALHNEYYKQPTFYLLAHFTKFLGPKSVRIGHTTDTSNENVHILTMINHEGLLVVIVLNTSENQVELRIKGFDGGMVWQTISAKTIQTYIGQAPIKS
ncbi:putative glucosylceramidase 4 [Tetranychus urticae]|uniref:Glucosylceramidase n=1 Tax=Tetranychus urticae TaxID=32264 RepID=T1L1D6_TETUR|nr:putative glucosylceramidase 4 [Tetranychus urticae]